MEAKLRATTTSARSRGNDENSMDFWSGVMNDGGSHERQTHAERQQQQQETEGSPQTDVQ